LGTVGVLLMSRGVRHAPLGSVNGPRYTVTTSLMAAKGGPLNACFAMPLPEPPIGCGGVEVANVDIASLPGAVTYQNGTVGTPAFKLVGTWNSHVFRLTEQPSPAKSGEWTQPTTVTRRAPVSSKDSPQQVMENLKRDKADLEKRGIILISFAAVGDGVDMTVAVADDKTVQYLYDHYGRVFIKGWLQAVDPTSSPEPTPTTVPPTGTYLPAAAQLGVPSTAVVWLKLAFGDLYRSTDQGKSWDHHRLPGGMIHSFSFISDLEGWVLAGGLPPGAQCTSAGAEVWHTTDAGATWQQVSAMQQSQSKDSGIAGAQCKERIYFYDSTHGFLNAWDNDHRPTIYRTADGGRTWSGSTLPDPPDFKTSAGGFSLRAGAFKRFDNNIYVEASGMQAGDVAGRQYMFRTSDGGATWSWLTKIPSRYIAMVTESRWLQLIVPGQSIESTNGGQQWHPYASDFNTDTPVGGPQVVFADSQIGYAEGRGALQRTVDGGLHWERIATPGYRPSPMPTPTPSQVGLLPVTDPGFTCRLPVSTDYWGKGGFVGVPRGTFEPDPAALMLNAYQWIETSAKPVLKGSGGFAFDATFSRWVPATPELVSADGTQYAWRDIETWPPQAVHVTLVADGSDRTYAIEAPKDSEIPYRSPFGPVPFAITKDTVYLAYGWEGLYGVWRLDLATGSFTKVSGLNSPSYGAGAIWVEVTRGPNRVGMYSDGDTLARLDLKSGAVQDWFRRDNVVVRHIGSDLAGNVWVQAINYHTTGPDRVLEIWRVRGPGQADLVLSGQTFSRVIADKHGVWFANETGVYLYSGGRVQRVSSAVVGEVAGPCI
jgi:photosystem II stability/assembly factor-like uncharacterized protein